MIWISADDEWMNSPERPILNILFSMTTEAPQVQKPTKNLQQTALAIKWIPISQLGKIDKQRMQPCNDTIIIAYVVQQQLA